MNTIRRATPRRMRTSSTAVTDDDTLGDQLRVTVIATSLAREAPGGSADPGGALARRCNHPADNFIQC